MTAQLAEVFQKLDSDEIEAASYLLEGRLLPQYQSLEFQMSVKMVVRALARAHWDAATAGEQTEGLFETDAVTTKEETATAAYKRLGDIGAAAAELFAARTTPTENFSILAVYEQLTTIARASGAGSQDTKVQKTAELFDTLDPTAAKFVARIIVGKVRLGFSTQTMLDALSWAIHGDKSDAKLLEDAYQKKADIGKLATEYLTAPDAATRTTALENYSVSVGIPIVPQLCQRLNTAEEMIEKMSKVYAEPKYDGLRVQIHIDTTAPEGEQYKVFTRSLEDATHMFPEVADLPAHLKVKKIILDGEAIGYDPTTGALLPFQETITRKRKHDVAETAAQIPLKFFLFDVLAADGTGYLNTPLNERKKLLAELVTETEQFIIADFITSTDAEELTAFHEAQLAEGLEGMVVKQVDSPYQSGRKGWYWVKIKEKAGTQGKLTDTIDGIVMGYYAGRGKRTQFGLGALLIGIRDTETDTIVTLAKTGTGMSEAQLVELKELCDAAAVPEKPEQYTVDKSLLADVWVQPQVVVELAADEITNSKNHSAGKALRFPRLLKIRDDKTWEQATTTQELTGIVIEGAAE